MSDVDNLIPTLGGHPTSVKLELEDDFSNVEGQAKTSMKPSSCTTGDYDEWLEIQKELGVYTPTTESSKCKYNNLVTANTGNLRPKVERTRANGEFRVSETSVASGSSSVVTSSTRRLSSATELERDLLEDTESLDGLALYSQSQCPGSLDISGESGNANDNDDITAQVQSAIDSILNLKKNPSTAVPGSANPAPQPSESKDSMLDQAVRSILGS